MVGRFIDACLQVAAAAARCSQLMRVVDKAELAVKTAEAAEAKADAAVKAAEAALSWLKDAEAMEAAKAEAEDEFYVATPKLQKERRAQSMRTVYTL